MRPFKRFKTADRASPREAVRGKLVSHNGEAPGTECEANARMFVTPCNRLAY